ncbi:MAG: hypothetical protein ACKV22_26495 [Bryobacteraceae bacterium]
MKTKTPDFLSSVTPRRSVCQALLGSLSLIVAAGQENPFAGRWEGRLNDLPGVDLQIDQAGGDLRGDVVFYFQLRGEDGKWRVANHNKVAMLVPRVKERQLLFEVRHAKKHGSPEPGPNARFRMELTGPGEAMLHKTAGDMPPIPLVRR